jgi:hypothetical protein
MSIDPAMFIIPCPEQYYYTIIPRSEQALPLILVNNWVPNRPNFSSQITDTNYDRPDKKLIKNATQSGFLTGFSDNIIWVELFLLLSISPLNVRSSKDCCER